MRLPVFFFHDAPENTNRNLGRANQPLGLIDYEVGGMLNGVDVYDGCSKYVQRARRLP